MTTSPSSCLECKSGHHMRCRYALDGTDCLCNQNAHRNVFTWEVMEDLP